MNQKELNEIRRRFKLDKNSISKIFGCYVNSNKEIIVRVCKRFPQIVYFAFQKKTHPQKILKILYTGFQFLRF